MSGRIQATTTGGPNDGQEGAGVRRAAHEGYGCSTWAGRPERKPPLALVLRVARKVGTAGIESSAVMKRREGTQSSAESKSCTCPLAS